MNPYNLTLNQLRQECAKRGIGSPKWRANAIADELRSALQTADRDTGDYTPTPTPQEDKPLKTETPTPTPSGDALASTLLQALLPHLPQQGIQEARVRQIVTEIIEARSPREVRVELPSGEKVDVGIVHQAFNRILQAVSANISGGILLVGGAGAGKTTTCHKVADALKLPFRTISVCKQTTLSHLVGFINVSGEYVSTPFREAYEKGGVFLLDEFDAGNENVVLALNSALANGLCEFPDKQIERHKDFRCLASANTYGTGATLQFVGRNKLDGATLDRFVVIEHDYDSKLEFALCGNDKWAERVLSIRKSIDKLGIRHIVSPRASINGAKLLAIGWKQAEVEQAVIWKGLDKSEVQRVLATL